MRSHTSPAPAKVLGDAESADAAWIIALAAARHAGTAASTGQLAAFGVCANGELRPMGHGHAGALIEWRPDSGWAALVDEQDPRRASLDLYLPIASATAARPITVGHLGQSLDGFIATHTGDSQFVTGRANIVHAHRMRAMSDAVVVGAGTVAADDPQLTTRHVEGPSPLRVIYDPARRLSPDYRVFTDDLAPTVYACARELVHEGETHVGTAPIVGLGSDADQTGVAELWQALRARGCTRLFIEGGGVTVSAFLEAGLLDRLHVAVAPLLIGDGRPAIRLPAQPVLRDCLRPAHRVFRMGGDVLFDFDLRDPAQAQPDERDAAIVRVL